MFSRIKRIYREHKELRYLAYHDSLTGLLNRNWLYKNIDQLEYKYVYFIDINDLHEVNKKGHTFGDRYINNVIATIKHDGILMRYAGDEFILFSNYKDEVRTNTLYSVGVAHYFGLMEKAIKEADSQMILNKRNFKLRHK